MQRIGSEQLGGVPLAELKGNNVEGLGPMQPEPKFKLREVIVVAGKSRNSGFAIVHDAAPGHSGWAYRKFSTRRMSLCEG